MAISPNDALGQKRELEKQKIDELGAKVNECLRRQWNGRDSVSFGFPDGVDYFVRSEVQKRFQAAGWVVNYHDDQRDGAYLVFTTPELRDQEKESLR